MDNYNNVWNIEKPKVRFSCGGMNETIYKRYEKIL